MVFSIIKKKRSYETDGTEQLKYYFIIIMLDGVPYVVGIFKVRSTDIGGPLVLKSSTTAAAAR